MRGRVLSIAGSDSGGGAGIQADIKTITALGGYAATAITALTAQDTRGVHAIHPVPADFLRLQIGCVLDDLGADAIKTGMLGDAATVEAVCVALEDHPVCSVVVVDPVMVSTTGHALLEPGAVAALKRRLIPKATVLTPNLPEAELLCGMSIPDLAAMHRAARLLQTLGASAVLLKGGHLDGEIVTDLLATGGQIEAFEGARLPGRNTHGTGCTLASAIATGLAQGYGLRDAVTRARGFVRAAIAGAPDYGHGAAGPLNHAVSCFPDML